MRHDLKKHECDQLHFAVKLLNERRTDGVFFSMTESEFFKPEQMVVNNVIKNKLINTQKSMMHSVPLSKIDLDQPRQTSFCMSLLAKTTCTRVL